MLTIHQEMELEANQTVKQVVAGCILLYLCTLTFAKVAKGVANDCSAVCDYLCEKIGIKSSTS